VSSCDKWEKAAKKESWEVGNSRRCKAEFWVP